MTTRMSKQRENNHKVAAALIPAVPVAVNTTGGSFLWTLMLCGLLTTLINVFYEAGSTIPVGPLHKGYSRFDPVQGQIEDNPPMKMVEWDNLDPELMRDKGHLLQLVKDAGITSVDEATLKKLPSWSDVTALYGEEPIIHGYPEQCAKFQNIPNKSYHFIATAGTFNTGTNLMSELLIANCHLPGHAGGGAGVRWQVQWGKHTPVDNEHYRLTHRTYKEPKYLAQYTFPVVMVRDPYKWMQSMCRHPYGAHWLHDVVDTSHCPNLVARAANPAKGVSERASDVWVKYANFTKSHDSLVGFWNDWYQAYLDASFPFLLVRFEDLIYHPRAVVQRACECAGGKLRQKFRYIVDSAKRGVAAHGAMSQRTSYLDALSRYGTAHGRYKGFHPVDLEYAKQHLDPNIMKMLAYPFHQDATRDAGT
ncbi:hypothetical protein ACA910_002584 [Epithemia clementina (nom. ined.)]